MNEANGISAGAIPAGFKTLLDRAKAGDETVLPALRQWLDSNPQAWTLTGDLAYQVQTSLIKKASGRDLAAEACIEYSVKDLRHKLAGSEPSALEDLLIDRIVTNWLHVHITELEYTQNLSGMSAPQAEYYQRRINHSHKRYLSSIKELARVRRMGLPAVQVNVGNQQVNVTQ